MNILLAYDTMQIDPLFWNPGGSFDFSPRGVRDWMYKQCNYRLF